MSEEKNWEQSRLASEKDRSRGGVTLILRLKVRKDRQKGLGKKIEVIRGGRVRWGVTVNGKQGRRGRAHQY